MGWSSGGVKRNLVIISLEGASELLPERRTQGTTERWITCVWSEMDDVDVVLSQGVTRGSRV